MRLRADWFSVRETWMNPDILIASEGKIAITSSDSIRAVSLETASFCLWMKNPENYCKID